jgi:hypothetical protein
MNTKWLLITVFVLPVALAGLIGYLVGIRWPLSPNQQQPGPSQQGPPSQQGGGPQQDKTYFTSTTDPKNWPVGTLAAEQASVPDIIELSADLGDYQKGSLLIYYVDFSSSPGDGREGVAVIASSDQGKTWGTKRKITLTGKKNKGAAVDPSVVQLPDGRLRLYFFGSETTSGDPAQAEGPHVVYSAISTDGVRFTVEDGERFAEQLTDPEVVLYKNQWYMYYSTGQSTGLAVSSDGLSFQKKQIMGGDVGGVPGVLVVEGNMRLYGCGRGGIASAVSSDGTNFQKDTNNVLGGKVQGIVCDPAIVRSASGTYFAVYKQRDETPQPGQPQPGDPRI